MKPATFAAVTILPGAVLGAVLESRQQGASVPDCVLQCIASSASGTNCATSDATCLCSSNVFVSQAASCFASQCNEQETVVGTEFGKQYCAAIGVTVTFDPAAASSTSAAEGPSSSSSSASPSTATSASAAPTSEGATSSLAATASTPAQTAAPSTPANGASKVFAASSALVGLALAAFVLA